MESVEGKTTLQTAQQLARWLGVEACVRVLGEDITVDVTRSER